MIFKIELVEGLEPGDLEIVKKLIEKIVKNIKHKTTLKNIEEGYVIKKYRRRLRTFCFRAF